MLVIFCIYQVISIGVRISSGPKGMRIKTAVSVKNSRKESKTGILWKFSDEEFDLRRQNSPRRGYTTREKADSDGKSLFSFRKHYSGSYNYITAYDEERRDY
jgi:hypothetical protein